MTTVRPVRLLEANTKKTTVRPVRLLEANTKMALFVQKTGTTKIQLTIVRISKKIARTDTSRSTIRITKTVTTRTRLLRTRRATPIRKTP